MRILSFYIIVLFPILNINLLEIKNVELFLPILSILNIIFINKSNWRIATHNRNLFSQLTLYMFVSLTDIPHTELGQ